MSQPQKKKPAKVHRKPPSAVYRTRPLEEEMEGRSFRVRDRDWGTIWGEGLTYAAAHLLKEKITGSNKSRTARIEDMEIPPPEWHPSHPMHPDHVASGKPAAGTPRPAPAADAQLEAIRQQALRAASVTAGQAQKRHEARDRSSLATAGAAMRLVPRTPVPVVSTEVAPDLTDEDLGVGVGDDEISDLMVDVGSDVLSDDEVARAKARRDRDAAEITARAQAMYEAQMTDGHVAWEQLPRNVQATWRFEASSADASMASD